MIVRDAAATLPACLQSARPLISEWLVIDTGSKDETMKVVSDTLDGIPGVLIERPWVNFAHNRSELLRLAREQCAADYVLMLDADHEVTVHESMPELHADSYLVRIDDVWGGRLPLVTRREHPFEYRGAAHSYLVSNTLTSRERLDAISIKGGGGASREKLERDRIALEKAFAEDPSDTRTVFYLAQTYRDLDMPEKAIVFYRLRAEMHGFDEERYFARFQLGVLLSEHQSFAHGAEELLRAWRERPTRVEALRALANAATNVADKYPVPSDSLFVMPAAYKKKS